MPATKRPEVGEAPVEPGDAHRPSGWDLKLSSIVSWLRARMETTSLARIMRQL
jgi:hypothetical protein